MNPVEETLNDVEKRKIEQIAQDETMIRALKKVLLYGIYNNGTLKPSEQPNPLRNFALQIDVNNIMTNEQLGAVLRASSQGIIAVEVAFKEIEKFKPLIKKPKEEKNQAR